MTICEGVVHAPGYTTQIRVEQNALDGASCQRTGDLLLLLDRAMKVMKMRVAGEGTMRLGYPENSVFVIGIILLLSTVLYAIPRASVLGAILLTGYLGGAVASNLRVSNPLPSYTLSPVYVGVLVLGRFVPARPGPARADTAAAPDRNRRTAHNVK
jgi:DoxX-like family